MQCVYQRKGKAVVGTLLLLVIVAILGVGCGPEEEAPVGALTIEGDGVEDKVSFTLEELKAMEDGLVEADYFSINSYGTEGYTHFNGIWVWHILDTKVKLKADAAKVSFIAEDGYEVEYSLAEVKRDDYIDQQKPETRYKMILAWEQNGNELDPEMDHPLQLVVGQREIGDVNRPYWVRNVKTIRVE